MQRASGEQILCRLAGHEVIKYSRSLHMDITLRLLSPFASREDICIVMDSWCRWGGGEASESAGWVSELANRRVEGSTWTELETRRTAEMKRCVSTQDLCSRSWE